MAVLGGGVVGKCGFPISQIGSDPMSSQDVFVTVPAQRTRFVSKARDAQDRYYVMLAGSEYNAVSHVGTCERKLQEYVIGNKSFFCFSRSCTTSCKTTGSRTIRASTWAR